MSETLDWAEAAEARLLTAAIARAPRLGWTGALVRAAARDAGLSAGEAELLAPGGPRDLAALLARRHDAAALDRLAAIDPASLKVRARIRCAVLERCAAAMGDEAATRRWLGFLLLPPNAALGPRLAWASADGLWRWAGDAATDENHYSKRLLLSEILFSTLAVRLASGKAAAERHLDQRIAGIMAFEKFKGRLALGDGPARAAGRLARLRYGAA